MPGWTRIPAHYRWHSRASAVPAQASVGQMQLINHACPPHANARSANLVCDVTGLSVFYIVSACPILQGKAVCFSYQTEVTQTSFWRLESTLGPPPRGYELRKCLCAAPKPCPNAWARHEKKPVQRTTRPALALPPPAPPPPAPSAGRVSNSGKSAGSAARRPCGPTWMVRMCV